MRVYIPTTKENDASKNVYDPNVLAWGGLRKDDLYKLGLTPDTLVSNGFGRQYQGEDYCYIRIEGIGDDVHHYAGSKLAYLSENGVKTSFGYILPTEKAKDWIDGNIPHVKAERADTISISVCQTNIARVGCDFVMTFVAFNNPEYERLEIVPRTQYKYCRNMGGHINIKVTRPFVMWGSEGEIENDIKGIIFDRLKDMGRIDGDCLTF